LVERSLACIANRIANPYAIRMAQLVTRVEDDLAAAVDQLVEAGVFASRSEAVRLGLEQLVDRCRRDEIGARIARGYRELPQSDAEVAWADESSLRMIAEEPW
jgi:Arc/MetJ-type ribon-helix-helix transcriptional regulator